MAKSLQHRINAGRVAVTNQVDFFHRQFGQVPSEWKEDDTRVTFADFAISERIFAELRQAFPGDAYCSEESNPADEAVSLRSGYGWILDPIDGTNNYALGMTSCAISLALLKNGVPVYGFIYDMSRRVLIQGGPGLGLLDGTHKASVKTEPLERQSIIGLHFPMNAAHYRALEQPLGIYRVRCLGSGALVAAYAAIGKLDGAIDFKVKVWDIAAAYALVLAGGGEFHFLDAPLFPIETFHPRLPPTPYVAGSSHFCKAALDWMGKPANPIPLATNGANEPTNE
ncbi:MAG: inositol monophosphatase [Verrucomicrobiota bacterium]|nr:inositol monophosphatase [Verrucomicrobiota bacterium]